MQVDWVTVAAQVVNFLVLVYILKRLLYRPVQTAMERRRRAIAARVEAADRREREAEDALARYEGELRAVEDSKEARLVTARGEVERERKRLLDAARSDVESARREWLRELERERGEMLGRLRSVVAEAALDASRRLLEETSGADLERRMVERFVVRLAEIDPGRLADLRRATGPVRIVSAFELDSAARALVADAVRDHVGESLAVEYAVSPALLGGLELTAGGIRVGWTLAGQLDELERRLALTLRPGGESEATGTGRVPARGRTAAGPLDA